MWFSKYKKTEWQKDENFHAILYKYFHHINIAFCARPRFSFCFSPPSPQKSKSMYPVELEVTTKSGKLKSRNHLRIAHPLWAKYAKGSWKTQTESRYWKPSKPNGGNGRNGVIGIGWGRKSFCSAVDGKLFRHYAAGYQAYRVRATDNILRYFPK